MRMRPAVLVAAGVLSVGLASGTASATESAASANAPAVSVAAPTTFTATAWGLGATATSADQAAFRALNARYTGCTNVVLIASYPLGAAWTAEAQGTCTGTV
ncbi:ABC-type glycerol-3-phosphate transport system substrate-binding protein [Catenulispora sp. MAP12-49]